MRPSDTQQYTGKYKDCLNLKIYLIMVTVLSSRKPHSRFQAPWSSWTPPPTIAPPSRVRSILGEHIRKCPAYTHRLLKVPHARVVPLAVVVAGGQTPLFFMATYLLTRDFFKRACEGVHCNYSAPAAILRDTVHKENIFSV